MEDDLDSTAERPGASAIDALGCNPGAGGGGMPTADRPAGTSTGKRSV
jgi:hypothetical protein